MKNAGSVQNVILPGWSWGQLHSPRDFQSGMHGENESRSVPLPESGISLFWRGWGGLRTEVLNSDYIYKLGVSLFFWHGTPGGKSQGAWKTSTESSIAVCVMYQVWVLGPRANADTSERLGNRKKKNGGRGSNNWAWNDSLPVEVQGGQSPQRGCWNSMMQAMQSGPTDTICFFPACLWRGNDQQSCDRVL